MEISDKFHLFITKYSFYLSVIDMADVSNFFKRMQPDYWTKRLLLLDSRQKLHGLNSQSRNLPPSGVFVRIPAKFEVFLGTPIDLGARSWRSSMSIYLRDIFFFLHITYLWIIVKRYTYSENIACFGPFPDWEKKLEKKIILNSGDVMTCLRKNILLFFICLLLLYAFSEAFYPLVLDDLNERVNYNV